MIFLFPFCLVLIELVQKGIVEQMLIFKSMDVRWPLSAMTNLMQKKKRVVNICELVWYTHLWVSMIYTKCDVKLWSNHLGNGDRYTRKAR